VLVNSNGYIGQPTYAGNNLVSVGGPGSLWSNQGDLYIGVWGSSNQLVIGGTGTVSSANGIVGMFNTATSNSVLVTGPASLWNNSASLYVGYTGSLNQLTITSGGSVLNTTGYVGYASVAASNAVLVTGAGSVWSNSGALYVGYSGSSNNLTIANSGMVVATNVIIGYSASTGNVITVGGGSLYATNQLGNGALDIRRGTLALNSGTVVVNQLYLTNNASSVMTFSAGLLRSGGSTVSNGTAFVVGDGVQSATLDLLGGTHSFASGLSISTNGNLIGNASIIGSVTNFGTIAPGHSAGTLSFSGDLTLKDSSALNMELGGTDTNTYDRVFVGGILRIAGLLNVTLTNGYTGSIGDTFDLFSFTSETGTFSQTNLPTLSPGMEWNTSKLYTLGDIQIVPEPGVSALLALGLAALASRRVKSEKLRVKS